jgi:hypothetical protein
VAHGSLSRIESSRDGQELLENWVRAGVALAPGGAEAALENAFEADSGRAEKAIVRRSTGVATEQECAEGGAG